MPDMPAVLTTVALAAKTRLQEAASVYRPRTEWNVWREITARISADDKRVYELVQYLLGHTSPTCVCPSMVTVRTNYSQTMPSPPRSSM